MDIDELYYQTVDLLEALIAIPRPSREEAAAADFLQAAFARCGFNAERHGNNLLLRHTHYDPTQPTILLNSHIDTVRPSSAWTTDPHTPIRTDDRIIGIGSNDAGASLLTLFAVFCYFADRPQAYNLLYLATAEEEVSGSNGMERMRSLLPPVAMAIVGEPTQMQPAIAEKGLMVIDCEVLGIAGHAAREEGLNAIYRALPIVEWISNHSFERVSPLLGRVKCTVTQIEAGTQHNIIPDRCRFVIDIRSNELYTNEEILDRLNLLCDCTLVPRSTRLYSSSIDPSNPFVARAVLLGRMPFGSPTLSDQALLRLPSVKIGVGDSARSHTADEFVLLDEIREGLELYIKLLEGLTI